MAKAPIPIATGFYVSDSLPVSNQRCVNAYVNIPQADTVTDAAIFGTEGIKELADADILTACRGGHEFGGKPYFVLGGNLYRLNRTVTENVESFDLDNLGAIEGVGRVYMADNGDQLCVVAPPDASTDGKSYIFTESPDSLVEITDPDFDGPASSVTYSDGLFVFSKADSDLFFNSAIKDGLSYDSQDFSQAVADPDNIRSVIAYRSQLYVLGSQTIEIFRNTARVPAPYVRLSGGVIDVGVSAPQSVKLFAGQFAFVGRSVNETPAVWLVSGGQKTKISTIAIDNELQKLSEAEVENIFAWVYAASGNYFYAFTTPSTTFVYDSTTQRWHERQSIKGASLTQCRVGTAVSAYGRVIVGDLQGGKIGELSETEYLEYGRLIRRFFTTKPFDNMGDPVFLAKTEVVVEAGVGLTDDITIESGTTILGAPITVTAGKDPQLTMSYSDNGGRTFIGEFSRSMGRMGEYNARPIWRRGGRFPRSRVLKYEMASPNKFAVVKAEVTLA